MKAIKLLCLWISEDLSWQLNFEEPCKTAYSRISLITNLKNVGVSTKELIEVYKLFICSALEYCSLVFHSRLSEDQSMMLEHAQAVCLCIILGQDYTIYGSSLRKFSLATLFPRREARINTLCDKALKQPIHNKMFPLSKNYQTNLPNLRNHVKYVVN